MAAGFVGWAVSHSAYAQLMFWRPVPNWQPSAEAFAPAVQVRDQMTLVLGQLQRQGALRADADLDEATDVWTVLISGLISQQLANEPDAPVESGRFTRLIRPLVRAFLAQYGARPRKKR